VVAYRHPLALSLVIAGLATLFSSPAMEAVGVGVDDSVMPVLWLGWPAVYLFLAVSLNQWNSILHQRSQLDATMYPDPVTIPWRTDDSTLRTLDRPGGARLSYRRSGAAPVTVLLLHGTLSTGAQLRGLAEALADSGAFTVLAVDRRGSGESRLAEPAPLPVQVHVDDLIAVLDAEGCRAAALVGISFGGVVALEFAARAPSRTLAVVAWEPPYGPLADAVTRHTFADVATATDRAYREGGSALAAETFMRGVAGLDSWERLGDRARSFLAAEGGGALVDAALTGLDPDGLARIDAPVILLTGDASESFYGPLAAVLASRIADGRRVRLPGLPHAGPITAPGRFAQAVVHALQSAGTIPPKGPVAAEPG